VYNVSCNNRCFFFCRLKINHESHEFILDPGTVAKTVRSRNWHVTFLLVQQKDRSFKKLACYLSSCPTERQVIQETGMLPFFLSDRKTGHSRNWHVTFLRVQPKDRPVKKLMCYILLVEQKDRPLKILACYLSSCPTERQAIQETDVLLFRITVEAAESR
jgi:hypothetical protein